MTGPIVIREYKTDDVREIGILIGDTYRKYNLSHIPKEDLEDYMDAFYHSRSTNPKHKKRIADLVSAPLVLVAVSNKRISGVLRGSPGRLHSLFVHEDFHRWGVGSQLMSTFEKYCIAKGVKKITMSASLYAVPFYQSLGYKKSTGIRRTNSFQGPDFHTQPMKKTF